MRFKFSSPAVANLANRRTNQDEAADRQDPSTRQHGSRFAQDSQRFARDSHAETLYPCGDSRDSRDSHDSRRAHTKIEQLTERELLSAAEARIGPGGLNELRTQAGKEPGRLAELARLIVATPPAPTAEDVAELDRLIVRLVELERPWLEGFLPTIQDARRRMAPIHVAENFANFRRWVAEAETRTTSTH
ncbi:MAG: hypothetical protein B7Y26_03590 [Hydrogenophilales bacterium 16-64-46]|nr:MAG: hypothetical protein B7Z32_03290 [Hydrogenophilales bacterium 12-64-13]OYZ06876.1 MAG: hypothetical protein B7Y26_03590 [Hydrogenophilales bacterium 16-64-46]OZA37020.1 MAG: hypothetical protein B7X87_11985 [Hydrogenophilales bacterium 17-64-34]HQS99904.1 hypothetical protein [Thiobacillus sp.]